MRQNESGRSMVEIVAVLAVVGILTIGGIAGYRFAVEKNIANTKADVVNKFFVLCQIKKKEAPSASCESVLDELNLDRDLFGYWDDAAVAGFGIIVEDVPQKACAQLAALDWRGWGEDYVLKKIKPDDSISPISGASDCDEPTAMVFSISHPSDVPPEEQPPPCISGHMCGATCCENASSACSGEVCVLANGCPEGKPLKDSDTARCNACDALVPVIIRSSATGCTSVCPNRFWGSDLCILCPEGMTLAGYYCTGTCDASEVYVCNGGGKQFCRCCPADRPKLANDECVAETPACSSISGCPAGEFCNYGGSTSPAAAKTPNVCMPINPQASAVNGKTYYYNYLNDLLSWCRGADNQMNCTWGYLARNGANSWCQGIGKRLMTSAELAAVAADLKDVLPRGGYGPNLYWTSNGAVNLDTGGIDSSRPDGYAWKGGVVCVD